MDDNWPDDLPAMHKQGETDELHALLACVPADTPALMVLWGEGADIKYRSLGIGRETAVRVLRNVIVALETEPGRTKH